MQKPLQFNIVFPHKEQMIADDFSNSYFQGTWMSGSRCSADAALHHHSRSDHWTDRRHDHRDYLLQQRWNWTPEVQYGNSECAVLRIIQVTFRQMKEKTVPVKRPKHGSVWELGKTRETDKRVLCSKKKRFLFTSRSVDWIVFFFQESVDHVEQWNHHGGARRCRRTTDLQRVGSARGARCGAHRAAQHSVRYCGMGVSQKYRYSHKPRQLLKKPLWVLNMHRSCCQL